MKKDINYYFKVDIPDAEIVEPDEDEFEIHAWKSRKTVGYAIKAVEAFINKNLPIARINKWPVKRTAAARRTATVRAIDLLKANNDVLVKQKNGSIYLIRKEKVA